MTPRILIWDLENSPGLGYFWGQTWKTDIIDVLEPTRVMSFAAKWLGGKDIEFRSVYHDGRQVMLERIAALLDECDAAVTYNGVKHDSPHIITEFIREGIEIPSPYREIDLYKVTRGKLKFHRNSLAYASGELQIGAKIAHEGFPLWLKCMADDDRAWARMRRYNIGDVTLTEKYYKQMRPLIPQSMHPNFNLYCDGESCPICGSSKIGRRGFTDTTVSRFPRYRCANCGKWSRGKKSVGSADIRGAS